MAVKKLTQKQKLILDYIKSQILEKGYPPSVRDICSAVSLKSTATVHAYLKRMEKNGYIRRDPAKPRAIEVLDEDFSLMRQDVKNVPLIGTVAAGMPILAQQNIEGYFPIPTEYANSTANFALKIQGDSMIEAGIFDGDIVFVKSTSDAKNGQIVVALMDDAATVKEFYREDHRIRLQPRNQSMQPIYPERCSILGVVFGVYRQIPV